MKMNIKLLSVSYFSLSITALTLLGASECLALSPPWWLLQAETAATIGRDKGVHVEGLVEEPINSGHYILNIKVTADASDHEKKTKALSTLLSRTHHFGNVTVLEQVLNSKNKVVPPGTFPTQPEEAQALISEALFDNPYYLGIAPGLTVSFFLVFAPYVVQYFGDNLTDAFKNFNKVAADAFAEILMLPVGLGTSTIPFTLENETAAESSFSQL